MTPRKVLVLGILVALLLGGLVAGAETYTAAEEPTRRSFTVPVGKVGDEVDIVTFWTGSWRSPNPNRTEVEQWKHGFKVLGLGESFDRTGMMHDTLVVEATTVWTGWGDGAFSVQTQHVDLDTRDFIQIQERYITDDFGLTDFGPVSEDPHPQWMGRRSLMFGQNDSFEFQGRTFYLGQHLSQEDQTPLFLDSVSGRLQGQRLGWTDEFANVAFLGYTSRIAHHGTLAGYEVFGLVRELAFDVVRINPRGEPVNRQEFHRTTIWLSPDVPYPVRIEREWERIAPPFDAPPPAVRNASWAHDLVAYRPGAKPIPWGACEATEHYRDHKPDAERAEGTHPTDGAGSRLRFPVADAITQVERDPSLTEFQSWKARHPARRLVGADFYTGAWTGHSAVWAGPVGVAHPPTSSNGDEVEAWDLVYVDAEDEQSSEPGFIVSSSRNRTNHLVVNQERGPGKVHPRSQVDYGELPATPITWAEVDRWWRAVGPPNQTLWQPNKLRWGLWWAAAAGSSTNWIYGDSKALHAAEIGYHRTKQRPEFTTAGQPPAAAVLWWPGDVVSTWVNVTSGAVITVFSWDQQKQTLPDPTAAIQRLEAAALPAQSIPPSIPARTEPILAGLLTTTTLLALVLVAYFYGLLKYFGTQALTLLPGYAKLRKDELLSHARRDELLQLVRAEPGVSPPELHRRLGGSWSAIVYHLRVLEKNKLVSSLIDGRHKRFFPVEGLDWSRRAAVAVLRNARTRQLYGLIEDDPGAIQGDLVRRLGITPPATRWHLDRLERVGLVGIERRGRKLHYFPAQESQPPRQPGMEFA